MKADQLMLGLQKRQTQQAISPQLAAEIAPLNAKIQSIAQQIKDIKIVNIAWDYLLMPTLSIQFESSYFACYQFIKALKRFDDLILVSLSINKADEIAPNLHIELHLQVATKT